MQKDEPYEKDAYEKVQTLEPGVQSLDPRGTSLRPRSEKETLERNLYTRNSKSKLQRNVSKANEIFLQRPRRYNRNTTTGGEHIYRGRTAPAACPTTEYFI